jgi:transposase-like protein
MEPETLTEAVRYFADLEICDLYMRRIKWPGGKPVCPQCGCDRIGTIASRHLLRCKDCRKQFSHKIGTIFEDSPLGLDKWFVAVWCIANARNGISSHELGRALGVTQKTAWFMLHRIRLAMESESFDKFDGPAEADTTYIGGLAINMHADKKARKVTGRGAVDKIAVHGVLQRTTEAGPSQVVPRVVGAETAVALLTEVRSHVKAGAAVYTDESPAYGELCFTHVHGSVNHSELQFKDGLAHTNGMENFWTLFKRSIKGTYIALAPWHVFRYAHEQAFRFNNRLMNDFDRFFQALSQVVGKRLTYRTLAAIDDAGFMGIP